jgi:NADH-ubiquinone oxidoreductase chain 5
MEGPTPVSALIHAATMVTAGVFLIIKLSPLFIFNSSIKFLILLIGSLTCIMAAIIGSTQTDLKKIIAYSTCSQLGYMVLVSGYGYYSVSLFHLFNHGIFKALLFLSAGLVIHTCFNEQSLLKMGLKGISPLGKYGFIVGNLAIIGFPFLTGYYSKDIFLELIAASNSYFYPL